MRIWPSQARSNLVPHVVASSSALVFAWLISRTAMVQTGVQFVGPLLVMFVIHIVWIAFRHELHRGFSSVLYRRGIATSLGLFLVILLANVVTPKPALAQSSVVAGFGIIVMCLLIIAVVGALVATIAYAVGSVVLGVVRGFSKRDDDDPKNSLFDFGSIGIVATLLVATSLEGVPNVYAFAKDGRATAHQVVGVRPDQVWITLGTATSPTQRLPAILAGFPQPVGVIVDEGVGLGAARVVKMEGREGSGLLTLRVVSRTGDEAVFDVLSDTSPFANWIAFQRLTYRVAPHPNGALLSVSLDYERKLAPAWVFGPMMKAASYFAVDVLARDVAQRAAQ